MQLSDKPRLRRYPPGGWFASGQDGSGAVAPTMIAACEMYAAMRKFAPLRTARMVPDRLNVQWLADDRRVVAETLARNLILGIFNPISGDHVIDPPGDC